ncbi:MAG: hypothetical protein GXO12_01265 [Epsilonproteobacteria bacterium]|nr:hypothetical protein [Campylobacterota bacterium]
MRITNQLLYSNFEKDYRKSSSELNKINTQLSSGKIIQNSFDDSSVYIDDIRLEYEKTTLEQVKQSTQRAQEFANNSDSALSEFTDGLMQFKTKLIQAANGANSPTSLDAIANDLEAIKQNLMDLANTSINGQFIFSGTAFSTKPIDSKGDYHGNDKTVKAITGADSSLPYNIDGKSLFLGSDNDYKKMVSTNIKLYSDDAKTILKSSDTVKDMMQYNGTNKTADNDTAYFYIQGKNGNGTAFKKKIDINTSDNVDTLLRKIQDSFSPDDSVEVVLNDFGQIEITDKKNAEKSLDFSIVGAIDGNAGVDDIDDLNSDVNIVSFVESGYTPSPDAANEAVSFDRNYFAVDGDTLTSNVSQIDKTTNDYATTKTKLVDGSGLDSLDGETLYLRFDDINGNTQNDVQIDFSSSGSTFSVNGTSYNIYDSEGNVTKADDMTYQQLNDVISMVVSNNLPVTNDKEGYDNAVDGAKSIVDVSLDYRGRMQIRDKLNASTDIKFSIYDSSSDDFSTDKGNSLSFMSNNAVTIDEPSIDLFKDIDEIIKSVREGKVSMDTEVPGDPRDMGIENAIRRIDHISDHVAKKHTLIGSLSNALNTSYQRSDLLSIQVQTLQSQVADVDIAEALAKYNQISLTYQAMLSTAAKINSMSLLNYM